MFVKVDEFPEGDVMRITVGSQSLPPRC